MTSARKDSKGAQKEDKFIQQPIQTVDGEVRIKKYVLIQTVGSGSYSKCYLVKNMDSDSTYVAKIIPKKKLEILQKQKLIYEIKIHQSLSHENVVHLDHWFEDENNQYIFMQYCPNGNLENKLSSVDGNMKESDIKRYGRQIVRAIQYIHSQNILHRDLKLCNFYLDVNNNVKLGDFGFACQLASQYDKKRETCGTPNYIAPEAISGFGYSFSSDVWAIGVILFRLKYGCCPFEGQTVKKTLENVKLCNYKLPSKPKISPQLKDLIQKIFNLNYDERLSTQQILKHAFFQQLSSDNKMNEQVKQQKRGFSLSRLFSLDKSKGKQTKQKKASQNGSDQKARQGIMQRQSRNTVGSVQKKQQPKRSNSCQTFKQIKQIFKNKSKQNLPTAGSVLVKKQSVTSPYYTLSTVVCTNREKDQGSIKTNRASIMQYSYSVSFNQTSDSINGGSGKKQESNISNRLNQFIKTQMNSTTLKDQLKFSKLNTSKNSIKIQAPFKSEKQIHETEGQAHNQNTMTKNTKPANTTNFISSQKIVKSSNLSHQQLFNYCRKFFLPHSVQQQKDFTIIHYKPTLKQIIYLNTGYILHRGVQNIYKMSGEPVSVNELPKVFKYIVENKIDIKQYENSEDYEYADNDINKILAYLPHGWVILKEGVILKYGPHSSLIVAKLFTQEGFYISDQNGQPLMYTIDSDQTPKLLEGVVIMRIYAGWVKVHSKK